MIFNVVLDKTVQEVEVAKDFLFGIKVTIEDEAILRSIDVEKLTKYLLDNGWTDGKCTLQSATAIMFNKPMCSSDLIIVEPGIKNDHIDKHVQMKRALRGIEKCHGINQFQVLYEIDKVILDA